ncbi:MAG TPA: hypothetical protein VFJ17_13330 [Mycobacteriales bacterium]|jgi:hypothetical protein|nr:hypothetical protein [Mycobacteriales bacterium]
MRTGRPLAARIVAGLGALFWGWMFFGVQDTLTVFVEGKDFAAHYLMETGWGLLFLVLVAVPLIGLAFRPRATVLVAQVATVGVSVLLGALMARSPAHLLPAGGLLLTAFVVGVLGRPDTRSYRLRVDRPLAVLALVAVVPALTYAWRMAHSPHDVEQTVNLDHYPIQAALGIAIALLAGLVAVAGEWPTAWLARATLVVTVGWMGIESAVYPHRLGSFGPAWSWLAVAWAALFALHVTATCDRLPESVLRTHRAD